MSGFAIAGSIHARKNSFTDRVHAAKFFLHRFRKLRTIVTLPGSVGYLERARGSLVEKPTWIPKRFTRGNFHDLRGFARERL